MAYQPKSYKKFVATAATATLVASAIAPVASAASFTDVADRYKEAVDYIVEKGYAQGYPGGTKFGTNDNIKRADAAVMVARALGAKADGDYPNAGFTDVPADRQWAVNFLYDKKIVDGKAAGEFGAHDFMTRGEMAKVIANAYKLTADKTNEFPFTDVSATFLEYVDALVEAGVTQGKTPTQYGTGENVTRGEFALFVYRAENPAPVAAAEVVSVSSSNLKEVAVGFNTAVSAADVKTTDFAVKNNTVSEVNLSSDGKTAVLTLGTAVAQQSDVEVTVKKSLKFENGAALADDVVNTINVTDVSIPTAQTIELTGPNTFEVTFSEPVKAVNPEVLINNGVYGVAERTLSADGRTLTVRLSASTLPEGTYDVKVSGYSDYANFAANSKTFKLEYKKDTSAPTVKLVSASQSEVVVEFDKAVTQKGGAALTKDFFYHTYSAWKPVAVETTDNKKFTLKFSDNDPATQDFILPEGNVTVTVLKSVGDVPVVDAWGNELTSDAKLTTTITADKVAPTVTKVEAKAENEVVVTFSEKVDLSNAKFEIKDSNDKKVTQTIGSPIAFDNEKLTATLKLSSKLTGGTYTVTVSDVVDTSLSENKITPVTVAFNVTDKTPMDLSETVVTVVDNTTAKEQYVYVTFPEAVATTGVYSALNKDNYLVKDTALAAADKVELFGTDNKRVRITVKYRDDAAVVTPNATTLTMGRIADAAGNAPTALSTSKTIAQDTAPKAFSAKAVALNKLELTFDAELKTVTADGIEVDGDGDGTFATVAAIDKVDVKDGKTVVTVTVKADESLNDKSSTELAKMEVRIVDNKLETITGQKLTGVTPDEVVADGVAPALESTDPVTLARKDATSAVITVDFDEALDTLHSLAATDLVVTDANGKVYVAGKDYTVDLNAGDASKLEITVTAADEATLDKLNGTKFSVATKATVNYIDDAAGNVIKVFEAKPTKQNLADN